MYFHRLVFFYLYIFSLFFFFNDTATTEIYTLSLHDALPIARVQPVHHFEVLVARDPDLHGRSEEHTSELQSRFDLVCRLLLEKKKKLATLLARLLDTKASGAENDEHKER